jgi:predicted enzyme related to lactoylglutathione lyase
MERVTGIGGIFFKAQDPAKLLAWYQEHLGLAPDAYGSVVFRWAEGAPAGEGGSTVWAPFPQDTTYFAPSPAPFMINYRVADLDAMLAQLRAAGVTVDERVEEAPFGRFGWAMDPEGNRFELWQPLSAE